MDGLFGGDLDFGERGFPKRNFSRRGTFEPSSQRKTATVDQYHPLRAPATPVFTDCGALFFAGANPPSRNAFSPLQQTFLIQRAQQRTPCVQPDLLLLPLLQTPPSGRWIGVLVGQEPPRRARPQGPRTPLQAGPVRRPPPACPCADSAQAAKAQSTPNAHRLTIEISSCSYKKFIKPPASRRRLQLDAEPNSETCSTTYSFPFCLSQRRSIALVERCNPWPRWCTRRRRQAIRVLL